MDRRMGSLLDRLLPDPCDIRQLFFTNLQLLGLDQAAMESKWRIPFNKEMFSLPNKRGFEVVMHFLFNALNLTRSAQEFRHCWPVHDKKQEQQFRKICNSWLTEIAKDDKDAHLPRIVASTFMSPGGDSFYHLLYAFSSYVVHRTILAEHGWKERDFLIRPMVTTQNKQVSSVIGLAMQSGMVRERSLFLEHIQQTLGIFEEWKKYTGMLVQQYRALIRQVREVETEVKTEIQNAAQRSAIHGSRRHAGLHGYDFDVLSVKRTQRIQKVRDLWRNVEDFHSHQEKSREIVESILLRTLEKYKIDSNDLNVKVPDLLLRECEQEIQRRRVDNIYQGGKLNLLSLLHLWNLSLHLYIEKLHKVGVASFEGAAPVVNAQIHVHQAHHTNVQSLRSQLTDDMLPSLKESIKKLKKQLDPKIVLNQSPDSMRTTSLGLGLLPPTPPVNLNAADDSMGKSPWITEALRTAPAQTTTPEGASQLLDKISRQVNAAHLSTLAQGSPVYAPRSTDPGQPPVSNSMLTASRIPAQDQKKPKTRKQYASVSQNQSGQVKITASGTTLAEFPRHKMEAAKQSLTAQASQNIIEQDNIKVFKAPVSTVTKKKHPKAKSVAPRIEKHAHKQVSLENTPPAMREKASQIVDMMLSSSPHDHIEDLKSHFEEQSVAEEAFVSKDKLTHTPMNQKGNPWHDTLLQDSYGPLSSTRIDHPHAPVYREEVEQVVTRLFSPEDSDQEEKIITVGKRESSLKTSKITDNIKLSPSHHVLMMTPEDRKSANSHHSVKSGDENYPNFEDQLPDLPLITAELEETMRQLQMDQTPKLQPRRTGLVTRNQKHKQFSESVPENITSSQSQSQHPLLCQLPGNDNRLNCDDKHSRTSGQQAGKCDLSLEPDLDESERCMESSEISSITSGTSNNSRPGIATAHSGLPGLQHSRKMNATLSSDGSQESHKLPHRTGDLSFEAMFGMEDELLTSITMPPTLYQDEKAGDELFVPLSPHMTNRMREGSLNISRTRDLYNLDSNQLQPNLQTGTISKVLTTSGVGTETNALLEEDIDHVQNLSSHVIHVQNGSYQEFVEKSPKKTLVSSVLDDDNHNNNSCLLDRIPETKKHNHFDGIKHNQLHLSTVAVETLVKENGNESFTDPNLNSMAQETEDIIARYKKLKLGLSGIQLDGGGSLQSPPLDESPLHMKYLKESPKHFNEYQSHRIRLSLEDLVDEDKVPELQQELPVIGTTLYSTGSLEKQQLSLPTQTSGHLSPSNGRIQTGVPSLPGTPSISMAATPVSPLTKVLHASGQNARLNLDDLLAAENDSFLLPSSLPEDICPELSTSPPVANLINI